MRKQLNCDSKLRVAQTAAGGEVKSRKVGFKYKLKEKGDEYSGRHCEDRWQFRNELERIQSCLCMSDVGVKIAVHEHGQQL
ncbi:hypothetical protein PAAG_06662 [Paracoccidioides lutzii Pb01]|uniref:Uncharacterized protein n=1 Tax=Paracoccidioides lutzii (strain ATCC MYA-826 / Pb01) TaxID=502779 RepID=C1H7C1_PARBA|nr:hypothetical protein PAAG_06662 [Paracoccidioides lutzii Pb01]EEH35615.2 hypothetical protein PAAG_06662 [Paracoccidioides lutzii Pb01]